MNYDQKECGRRMAELRGRNHLVQEEAAERLGISVLLASGDFNHSASD